MTGKTTDPRDAALMKQIADAVIGDEDTILQGFNAAPAHLARAACKMLDLERLDLLGKPAFAAAYDTGGRRAMLGHALIACLRGLVFLRASKIGLGDPDNNAVEIVHAQIWQTKLLEAWLARRKGERPRHRWIN